MVRMKQDYHSVSFTLFYGSVGYKWIISSIHRLQTRRRQGKLEGSHTWAPCAEGSHSCLSALPWSAGTDMPAAKGMLLDAVVTPDIILTRLQPRH
jgi:hypothetical protein